MRTRKKANLNCLKQTLVTTAVNVGNRAMTMMIAEGGAMYVAPMMTSAQLHPGQDVAASMKQSKMH